MISEYLRLQLENEFITLPYFRVILLNAAGAITTATDTAEILNWEPIQKTGGYSPVAYPVPTAGSATWDATALRAELPVVNAPFTEAAGGAGYTATHAAIWQGRGVISNKPIGAIDLTTNRITCTGHGLVNGDRAFVRSEGTLPGGLSIQRYWAQRIDADTVVLHSNSGLSAAVDITSTGTGTLYLQHANGRLARAPYLLPGGSVSFTAGITRAVQVKVRSGAGGIS